MASGFEVFRKRLREVIVLWRKERGSVVSAITRVGEKMGKTGSSLFIKEKRGRGA